MADRQDAVSYDGPGRGGPMVEAQGGFIARTPQAFQQLRWEMERLAGESACLQKVSSILGGEGNLAGIFRDVAAVIEAAWQNSKDTRVRIVLDGQVHAGEPFEPTDRKLISDIMVAGDKRGQLEIYYLPELPDIDGGAFTGRQHKLADSLAGMIAQAAEKKSIAEALSFQSRMIEQTVEGIMALDLRGNILLANQTMAAMHGYETHELIGEHYSTLHTPEQVAYVEAVGHELLRAGKFVGEFGHVRRDGSVFPTMMRMALLRDDNGAAIGVIKTCLDISQHKKVEEDVLYQAELNQVLLDAMPCVAILLKLTTREIVACNESARQVGCVVGSTCYGAWRKHDAPCPWCMAPEAWTTGQPQRQEIRYLDFVYDAHWIPLADDMYLHCVFDITDRKRAEDELHQRTHDLDERVKELKCLYSISALVEQPDISLAEIARRVARIIPFSWQYPEIACARVVLDDQEYKTDNFAESPWSQACEIVVNGETCGSVAVYYLAERPECYEGPFTKEERGLIDAVAEHLGRIVERKQAEDDLHTERRRLRALANELSLAEERERQRLSAALHDDVSQELAAAKIRIGILGREMKDSQHAQAIGDIFQTIDQALRHISSLTFELCPPVLYRRGLVAGLEWLVGHFNHRHGVSFEFVGEDTSMPLTDEVRGLVFQVVRELLTNVIKHAQARQVVVTVKTTEDDLTVMVVDDGVGFDPTLVARHDNDMGGFGLFSIRQRISYFGGQLSIGSAGRRGSLITITIPIGNED